MLFSFIFNGDVLATEPSHRYYFKVVMHELVQTIILIVDILESKPVITLCEVFGCDDTSAVTFIIACKG